MRTFISAPTAISIFIVFHLLALVSDSLFWTSGMQQFGPIRAYINFFGLYQNWAMFEKAPAADYYLCAVITEKSGKRNLVEFEHMENLPLFERLKLHRFRKFQQSFVFNQKYSALYPHVCFWILNNQSIQKKDVDSITLYQKELSLADHSEKMHRFFEMKGPFHD